MAFLYISDDPHLSTGTILKLRRFLPLKPVVLSEIPCSDVRPEQIVFVDIRLSDFEAIRQFKQLRLTELTGLAKIFVLRGSTHAESFQANALGATATISAQVNASDANVLLKLCGPPKQGNCNEAPEVAVKAAARMEALQDSLQGAVASGEPLPKAEVLNTGNELADSLKDVAIGQWLGAVRQHHSYTYRHCMGVSALTVAFALHLGFSDADVQRMSVGAILHDLGKVKIPMELLDKPGELTGEERAEFDRHPNYGFEILQNDGQFSDEVLDIALHHHELLDGSGYPDGLSGSQIRDPVRIVAIVDKFASLIDQREPQKSLSVKQAYDVLLSLDGKLEVALVRAFEHIARVARSSPMAVHFQNIRVS